METHPTDERLYELLKKYWGFDTFRGVQLPAMRRVLQGLDTLALMPTGAGKSLTYQLPTLAGEGLCIVVTPLIALMKDQVDGLRRRGIPATAVHSGMTPRQIDMALDNCVWGDIRFLYIAPERIGTDIFRMRVQKMHVSLIAVDEAHCISQWGYDFRPAYLRIARLREMLPDVPVLALTASATPRVAEDIARQLQFRNGAILRGSFARPNLSFAVRHTEDRNGHLIRIIRNVPGSGIVYLRSREGTVQLAEWLQQQGISAEAYHAGMGYAERGIRQEAWRTGKTRVMVATNAFGMGIDKADVRFVVHYDVGDSLEGYYQEAGRAGRDGRRAYAVLLVGPDARSRSLKRFGMEFPALETIRKCYRDLFNYLQVPIGEGKFYSFPFNIFEFASHAKMYVGTVQHVLKLLQMNGYMTLTDETEHPARLMFCIGRDDLYKLRVEREDLDTILRAILRLYAGVFTEFRPISTEELAQVTTYREEKVKELLKTLWRLRVIRYIPRAVTPMLVLDEERLPDRDVYISPQSYQQRKAVMQERLEGIFAYADNETRCRHALLQAYFGETDPPDCGTCDVCLARKKQGATPEETDRKVLERLAEAPATLQSLAATFRCPLQAVHESVDRLLAAGKIWLDAGGILRVNA